MKSDAVLNASLFRMAGMASFTNLLNEVARTEIDFPLLRSTDLPEPSES